MSSFIYDMFRKDEPTEDIMGSNKKTFDFFKQVCEKLEFSGTMESYYYTGDGNHNCIIVVMDNTTIDPYDDTEKYQTYEVEFDDFEVLPETQGGNPAEDVVARVRNKKYQTLVRQFIAQNDSKKAKDYQKGCNQFNGMRYGESAPKPTDPKSDPQQTTLDMVEESFDELMSEASFDQEDEFLDQVDPEEEKKTQEYFENMGKNPDDDGRIS